MKTKKINRVRDIKFNVFSDKRSMKRFRVIGGNGKILAKSTRGFDDLEDLVDIVYWLTEELRVPNIYQDKLGRWRWRCKMGNIIAMVSSESYENRNDCKLASWLVLESTLKV